MFAAHIVTSEKLTRTLAHNPRTLCNVKARCWPSSLAETPKRWYISRLLFQACTRDLLHRIACACTGTFCESITLTVRVIDCECLCFSERRSTLHQCSHTAMPDLLLLACTSMIFRRIGIKKVCVRGCACVCLSRTEGGGVQACRTRASDLKPENMCSAHTCTHVCHACIHSDVFHTHTAISLPGSRQERSKEWVEAVYRLAEARQVLLLLNPHSQALTPIDFRRLGCDR
jgi:hypothetical protein